MYRREEERGERDPALQRHHLGKEVERGEVGVAARVSGESGKVHRQESRVRPDERQVEVQFPKPLVHHASEHQREPVEGGGEYAEECGNPHDQVKMRHHEVRVVEVSVDLWLSQEESGESAGHEDGYEAEREQHRGREAQRPVPCGRNPVERFHGGRRADHHRQQRECDGRIRAQSADEHVMSPDQQSQEGDRDGRQDHGAVPEHRFAREVGDQMRDDAHGGEDCDVDLGVSEKPEQMLPEQGRAAAVPDGFIGDEKPGGDEETGAAEAVEQNQKQRGEEH